MSKPLNDEWRDWLRLNIGRGCDPADLFERAMRQGFNPAEISQVLDGFSPPAPEDSALAEFWRSLYNAPLTKPENTPRAWRLDTEVAQIYEIPDLLSADECAEMIDVIDLSLKPSTVTRGPADYRTSRTCHMRRADPDTMRGIDERLAALIGCDPAFSEPIQGQRYDPGQYFKAHTDCFAPNTAEFEKHTKTGGQRTWTIMVYLNQVPSGGETRFERVGRTFQPLAGTAIAWNNIGADGAPNTATLHEALPVEEGVKYVITKWFRERAGLNS